MAVPKRVPADATYPHLFCGRNKPVLLNSARPVRLSCIWICKYPVFFVRRRSIPQLMLSQLLRQRRVEWHPSLGSRRLHGAGYSVNIRLAYAQSHAFPIDITPLQAEYFANPKSHAHCHDAHRSKRLGDVFRHLPEFVCGKSSWLSYSFRTVFYAYEAHGIELIREQLPAHRNLRAMP